MAHHSDSKRLGRAIAKALGYAGPWAGDLFRSASPRYASKEDIVTGAGSKTVGGRWNPPRSFRAIYTSLDVETAVAESLAHFRYYGYRIAKAMPRILVALETKLQRVLA